MSTTKKQQKINQQVLQDARTAALEANWMKGKMSSTEKDILAAGREKVTTKKK